jgi:hypothetical protein
VVKNTSFLNKVMAKLDLSDLSSDKVKIKYACANQAIVISQSHPDLRNY